jgi:hypothetical protein
MNKMANDLSDAVHAANYQVVRYANLTYLKES